MTTTTTPTAAAVSAMFEERSRDRKAQDAVDAIMHMAVITERPTPEPAAIDRLDDGGWAAISAHVSRVRGRTVKYESEATRLAVQRVYRERIEFRRAQADMTLAEMFDV